MSDQFFSGNLLDRSFGRRKDENFLSECLETNPKLLIVSIPGQDLKPGSDGRSSTSPRLLCYDSYIEYCNIDEVLLITSCNSISDLIERYIVILLGCLHNTTDSASNTIISNSEVFNFHDYTDSPVKNKHDPVKECEEWYISIALPSSIATLVLNHKRKQVEDPNSLKYEDGRSMLVKLRSQHELAMAGQAIALVSWHEASKFDGRLGQTTTPIECGMKRIPTGSSSSLSKLYPRVDPVVIGCIISPDGKMCLLGKMRKMPKNFFSCLSGFIEVCESVEEALRREVWEESGIKVGKVEIISSQPWPIGRGGGCELMIGCLGYATTTEVTIQDPEVEIVQWFSRADALRMIEHSLLQKDLRPSDEPFVPGPYAIAHHLIKKFTEISGENPAISHRDPNSSHLLSSNAEQSIKRPDGSSSTTGVGAGAVFIGVGIGILLSKFVQLDYKAVYSSIFEMKSK